MVRSRLGRDIFPQDKIHPMAPQIFLLLITSLIIATLLSGCAEQASPRTAVPPAETAAPATTGPPTPQAPGVTATLEPFPGALFLGTPYEYGREDISMEVTVYQVKVMDEYEWWSPEGGRYWNTTPGSGNQFLFALVRLVDRGTAKARFPSSSMFVLKGNGGSYVPRPSTGTTASGSRGSMSSSTTSTTTPPRAG